MDDVTAVFLSLSNVECNEKLTQEMHLDFDLSPVDCRVVSGAEGNKGQESGRTNF